MMFFRFVHQSHRERLLFLLTPEAQKQLATRISEEERKQVDDRMTAAITAWKRIEADFLSSIKMDKATFINHISEAGFKRTYSRGTFRSL